MFEIFSFRQRHCDESCHPEATQENLTGDCKSKVPVHVCQAAPAYDSEGVWLDPDEIKEGPEKEKAKGFADDCSESVNDFKIVVSNLLTEREWG